MQTATTTNGTDPMAFDAVMGVHQRIAPGAILLLLAFVLSACSPSAQSVSRSSAGAPAGTTMHMSLKDEFSAQIGGELLGSEQQGVDQLVGDLSETGATWRGTVTGSAKRTIYTNVLDTKCNTELSGTQQIEVVGTRGTYPDGRNLMLAFSPVNPPSYDTVPLCDQPQAKPIAKNGIEWLDFYFDAYQDEGMAVKLPDRPGGTWTWDLSSPNVAYPGYCGDPTLKVLRCSRTTTLTVEYH